MASIPYPFRVTDNSGNLVSGATIEIGAVTLTAGTAANVPAAKGLAAGGSLNGSTGISVTYYDFGDGDYVIVYDPESFGEAYIPVAPSKSGSTITGANALIAVIATKDSSRVQTALPNAAPATSGGIPTGDASGRVLLQPAQSGVTIPIVTTITNNVAGVTGVTFPATVPSLSAMQAALPSDSSIAADVQTGLTTQGYTTARAGFLDTLNGIVAAIWAAATRTLTAIGNSAGVNTLLTYFSGAVAPQSGDAFARLGAPAGASTSADIAAIETKLGSPAGASTSADIAAIESKLGSPAGASVSADIATANSALSLSLSLLGQNQGIRNQAYDGSGNLTSADICAYSSAADATTNDGSTGLTHKWTLTLTYASGQQATQSIAQVS